METSTHQVFTPETLEKSQLLSVSEERQSVWPWLLLVLGMLLGGGGFTFWRQLSPDGVPTPAINPPLSPIRPVETVVINQGKGMKPIQLLGQAQRRESVTIRTHTPGIVQRVNRNPKQ